MMMKQHVSRNALDFFLQKADSIQVRCDLGRIFVDICMEHNSGGRLDRFIGIAKDEEGFVRLNCYEDWGGGEQGSASIEDDELKALLEFLPAFLSGKDQLTQISSMLLRSKDDLLRMRLTASAAEFLWGRGACGEYSCSISRNPELQLEGEAPEGLEEEVKRAVLLIWDSQKQSA